MSRAVLAGPSAASSAHGARPVHDLRGAMPFAPLAFFLLAAFVLPVLTVLTLSVWTPQTGWQAAPLERLFTAPVYRTVLWRTLHIAAVTTALSVLGALPIALLWHRLTGRAQQALYLLVLLPLWTSFLVKSFAWMVLLGKNGAINALLTALAGTPAAEPLLFNFGAVIVGMVHGLMPFAVLTMLPVLQAIDARLPQAAATLGARPAEAFVRVTLPLLMPGVAAAALIVFVTALGFFIVPALLGGPRQTMVANVIIDLVQELLNWPLAAAASAVMLALVALLFWLFVRAFGIETLVGRGRVQQRLQVVAAAPSRVAALRRRFWLAFDAVARHLPGRPLRHGLDALTLAVVAFLALPALFLVPVSFSTSGIVDWPPQFFSTRWYEALAAPAWRGAAWRSFSVAAATGVLSLALAYPAAVWFVRHAQRARVPALVFMIAPMVVPRIVIAIGLFYLFARIGLVGSWLGLVLGHAVIALPFVVTTLIAVVQGYDERLDQAAAVCGAAPPRRLLRITLPLLAPGLLSAFLFAFVTSLDELTIALFVTGGLSATLPKQMWDEALLRVSPTLAAASTVLFVVMSATVLAAQALRRRP